MGEKLSSGAGSGAGAAPGVGAAPASGKRRIIVCIPRFATGGPIAMYALARYLREAGHDARVFWYGPWRRVPGDDLSYWYYRELFNLVDASKAARVKLFGPERYEGDVRFPAYIHPDMKGVPRKFLSSCRADDVVIYPEEIYGNPLGARNVVRWLLYFNRYVGEPAAYGDDDQFFCYKIAFNDEELNPRKRILYVNHFNLDFYKQTNFGERSGTCYLIKKGARRPDLPAEFDGPLLDDMPEREKVRLFNECKRFVSYDLHTAYSSIAVMCGCESVVVPEPGKSRADYETSELSYDGIAFDDSPEELAHAAATRERMIGSFEAFNENSRLDAAQFGRWVDEFFDARDRGASEDELAEIDELMSYKGHGISVRGDVIYKWQ